MRTLRFRAGSMAVAVTLVAVPACGGDDGELDQVRAKLVAVSAERDSLRAELETGYVIAEAVEPTERQIEMIEVVRQFLGAWNASDAELAASLMTVNGTVDAGGWFEMVVDDGALVTPKPNDSNPMILGPAVELSEPMLIAGDHVAVAVGYPFEARLWVFEFISTGAVKIMNVRWL